MAGFPQFLFGDLWDGFPKDAAYGFLRNGNTFTFIEVLRKQLGWKLIVLDFNQFQNRLHVIGIEIAAVIAGVVGTVIKVRRFSAAFLDVVHQDGGIFTAALFTVVGDVFLADGGDGTPFFSTMPFVLMESDAFAVLTRDLAEAYARIMPLTILEDAKDCLPQVQFQWTPSIVWHARSSEDYALQWLRSMIVAHFESRRVRPM